MPRSNRKTSGTVALRLFDPRRGDLAFKLEKLAQEEFSQPQRFNFFTVLWIREGNGTLNVDLAAHSFRGPALLFFNPYQTFFLQCRSPLRGVSLQFHANFFCIETHHEAVGCNGVLFNNIYGAPLVQIDRALAPKVEAMLSQMEQEFEAAGLGHAEALVSYLKLFLIKATRLKLDQQKLSPPNIATIKPPALDQLTQLIEQNYRTMHSPAEYAAALHITPNALGKLVKTHFGKTLTELIRDRLLLHAKWQLLHTRRPVKEIAWEIGFIDELYFSRLFKSATGCSPTSFREFETEIRGGRNLSM